MPEQGGRHRQRSEMPFTADLGKGVGGRQHLESPCSGVRERGMAAGATGPLAVMNAGPCITHCACQAA
ncbi:uncharacterized [Tachysurus ichikawai]